MSAAIEADTAVLVEIADLIGDKRPLIAWPESAQSVLGLALNDASATRVERAKAEQLRRHLFGDLPVPIFAGADAPARRAERVRADLPGIVPFGSGFHLSDPAAIAQSWLAAAR